MQLSCNFSICACRSRHVLRWRTVASYTALILRVNSLRAKHAAFALERFLGEFSPATGTLFKSCSIRLGILWTSNYTYLPLPDGLVVRIWRSHRHGPGSIPGQGNQQLLCKVREVMLSYKLSFIYILTLGYIRESSLRT